ncbi:MAG: UDP-N-acetylmuramoyl-L-alanyl-D-glutamate--2,6-diaminopimelate ligase, partial [Chloroflexi bacterium]|nr:UDP-N-acetylmuramoyl-L-alanyl-D-glutamate--2,6-diaminopimelate ligase [Chloroflexota bacterium]
LDSRQVKPGDIFVALEGINSDGHNFIPQAVESGAKAVVGTRPMAGMNVPYLKVKDGRLALAQLSAAFYSFPGRELTVIGVTGTDGKTTTANLIYEILRASGIQAGMISTVNAQIGAKVLDTGFHVTTPEAPDVQRYLAEMVTAGITHVVLEATSHGLEQQRVACCEFDLAVVTNITHEHLDYHGSYDAYRSAKGRLFSELAETHSKKRGNPRLAVLNQDDMSFEHLRDLVQELEPVAQIVTYGLQTGAGVRGEKIDPHSQGLRFTARARDLQITIESNLIGAYNIPNCLAAIAATAVGLGVEERFVQQGIASMQGIPGRMEVIDLGQDFLAIVDFAHTPNALQRALQSARQLTKGRVIAVFGSAGLRDKAKRRMMAEVSAKFADISVLTAEDPRIESLDAILAEMAEGSQSQGGQEGKSFWRIPDRGEAMRHAIYLAEPGDIVISCGKGHEQSMCFGEFEYPWDDRTAMRAALSELLGIEGPQMPYLPTQNG